MGGQRGDIEPGKGVGGSRRSCDNTGHSVDKAEETPHCTKHNKSSDHVHDDPNRIGLEY